MNIKQLHHISDWQEMVVQLGNTSEIVVIKTSPTCPISMSAERRFNQWAGTLPEEQPLILVKVDVKADRLLSQFIAEELHVKHESPQVIWLNLDNKVKWHKSHQDITEKALQAQL